LPQKAHLSRAREGVMDSWPLVISFAATAAGIFVYGFLFAV
jgi:hypothetical protein